MKPLLVGVTFVIALLAAAPSHAQQPPPKQPTAAQEGYVPVDQLPNAPARETIPAAGLVGAAYGVVWVVLLLYVWSIWSRLGKVERELQSVSRRIPGGGRPA